MDRRIVLIVLDGLRPDFVSDIFTPHIAALEAEGTAFRNHHACFPSVTRLNSASIATGCHPGGHGIVDNVLYLPDIQPGRPIDTGDCAQLRRLDDATDGGLLDTPSLSEILEQEGREVAVVSTCTTGACFLQNHRSFGLTVNHGFVHPASAQARIEARFGAAPTKVLPAADLNGWATAIATDYVLPELRPDLLIMWLCDPDSTQHRFGPGAPESLQSIAEVDRCVGRIIRMLEEVGMRGDTDLLVLSDHGWIGHSAPLQVRDALVTSGIKQAEDSDDVAVVGQGVYIGEGAGIAATDVVSCLRRMAGMGALFTSDSADGTLPLGAVGGEHPRAPDVLFAPRWDHSPNPHGAPGMGFGGGPGGHGGSSPYEMKSVLVASGPDFRKGAVVTTPTGQIDILPTVLHVLGHRPAPGKDGRVLLEALVDGISPDEVDVREETLIAEAGGDGDTGRTAIRRFRVGDAFYVSEARAKRFLK